MPGYIEESDFIMVEEGFMARDLMEEIINDVSQTDDRDAFFVADLGDVVKKHLRFLKALPRVKPFYAVKCNSSRGVIQILAELGAGFDCASKVIMEKIHSLWGPTVDGLDQSAEHLSARASVGDWLLFDNMGAYNRWNLLHSNGFQQYRIHTQCPGSLG
ncbi:hypothetical protein GDO81_005836 [Engystomops pustulosus]|uniref:Orn/DAP/Arg decarboxylase 2 N-terminal domain-containing protein n=1 Tax=Engystomops pustulosus TaxID=76066 RepID=A0AAV7CTS1_ENGPU|nr:hypothetical protein GDO81_005836 [Engystomops pustulosus]